MEITGIHHLNKLTKPQLSEKVSTVSREDTISISTESKKRAEWVEMLKQMPEIRPEKIEAALASDHQSSEVLKAVAQKLLQDP